jgi:hypothetical protein
MWWMDETLPILDKPEEDKAQFYMCLVTRQTWLNTEIGDHWGANGKTYLVVNKSGNSVDGYSLTGMEK